MKKTLLALAVSLAAASGAHAAWDSGSDGQGFSNVGNGEAVLLLWDPVAKSSYTQDLGVRFDDLLSGAAFGQNIGLNSAALSTAFSGSYSNVQWTVVAASNHNANADQTVFETASYGWINTGKANTLPQITDPQIQLDYVTGLTFRTPQLAAIESAVPGNAFNDLSGSVANNGTLAVINGGPGYTEDWIADVSAYLPGGMQTAAANGQTTNLWWFGFADNDGAVPLDKILGTVTLNLSGNTGTLSLNSAPAVPVPAAVWLLGSALAGLGGIARSRKQA